MRTRARRGQGSRGAGAAQCVSPWTTLELGDEQARRKGIAGARSVDSLDRGRRSAGELTPALQQDRTFGPEGECGQAASVTLSCFADALPVVMVWAAPHQQVKATTMPWSVRPVAPLSVLTEFGW